MKTLLLLFAVCCSQVVEAAKPNILLIYTDDHGWADFGAQGVDKDIRTPNIDQLARDGVICKRGYVTAPQCTPSRAGVMTGMYQNRFGVEHNGIAMRSEVVTLPKRLKAAGYVSGMSGKWHLDVTERRKTDPELAPHKQGFDEYFNGSMHDYSASHALDGTPFPDAPHKVHDDRCRVVIQTEGALSFLKRRAAKPEQPWFLYLAYMAPHVPMESPEPWFSKTPAHLPKERRQALALIGAIDDGVGRIRAKLKEMGQEQNTLIFMIGDNGAPLGNAWDGSINLPMRGQKGMLSEGGIRTPFLTAWPGKIPGGQIYDQPVISLDVAATALAIAGLDSTHHAPRDVSGADLTRSVRSTLSLDGVNLMPFLTGENKASPHQTLYWRWMSQAAVQEFPYKLIALGGRGNLLFDITTPEGEAMERNLVKQKPDIAARLEAKLNAWTATLEPPGMPPPLADRHVMLFSEHGMIAPGNVGATHASPLPGTIQGWLCRGGTLAIKDGALVITRESDMRGFITNSQLDLVGPVTATVRVRARQGGKSRLTWRIKQDPDFLPANSVAFDWPASSEWKEVKTELPVKGRMIHLRITPANGSTGLEVQSIELRGSDNKTQSWRFDGVK